MNRKFVNMFMPKLCLHLVGAAIAGSLVLVAISLLKTQEYRRFIERR